MISICLVLSEWNAPELRSILFLTSFNTSYNTIISCFKTTRCFSNFFLLIRICFLMPRIPKSFLFLTDRTLMTIGIMVNTVLLKTKVWLLTTLIWFKFLIYWNTMEFNNLEEFLCFWINRKKTNPNWKKDLLLLLLWGMLTMVKHPCWMQSVMRM